MPHVTAVQFRPTNQRPQDEARLLSLLRRTPATDLLVLPECCLSGYNHPVARYQQLAEKPKGPTFQLLRTIAMEKGCHLVAGFIEDATACLYNSALVISPQGQLVSLYRKQWLYIADRSWARFSPEVPQIIQTPSFAFATGICMDINSDLFLQWVAQANVDVLAFPTNWVKEDRFTRAAGRDEDDDVWPYWLDRWRGQSSVLVAANTWGSQGDSAFVGKSAILSPQGLQSTADPTGDTFISHAW